LDSNGHVKMSPYDRAMALCPSNSARLELARLGAELSLGASSPEWVVVVLHAQARGLFGEVESERAALLAQLKRIEARLEQTVTLAALQPALRRSASPIEVTRRDLCVFTVALLVFVLAAISATGLPPPPFFVLIATFVLGLCAALMYVWLPPIFTRRK
jgi:RsiW-degrading membrane proteinase PrsW (M82 family)